MIMQTKYSYEKTWSDTNEKDILKIICEEIGDIDSQGTLEYIVEVCKNGRTISVGNCKFRAKEIN
jgi:hypothetical protein